MADGHKVTAARIEVEKAKGALLDTANELMERFQPHNLVDDLWESAKDKGADLAEGAVDAVAKRPIAVGSAVAALAMFLAREPLKQATIKFYDVMTPLFEPRKKVVALREKQSAKRPKASARKAPAKERAKSPRRTAVKKTEKA